MNSILSILRIALGVVLIVAGIAGIFLPFVQGLLLIFAGLVLLFGKKAVMLFMHKAKKKAMLFFGQR